MWLVLMSVSFNIRTDLYQTPVTCWLTSKAQCTLVRQKGEELKVQRPPSCGISHSSIDLGGGGGVTQECQTSQGCVSCAFHCREASFAKTMVLSMCACLHVLLFAGGALLIFWSEGANRPPKVCLDCFLRSSWYCRDVKTCWYWKGVKKINEKELIVVFGFSFSLENCY